MILLHDTDRRQYKDRSRSKQQSKCHKKNSHKGKPCYEGQHSSKNSSDKPTEKSRHDDQDYESRTVTNPYLEKASLHSGHNYRMPRKKEAPTCSKLLLLQDAHRPRCSFIFQMLYNRLPRGTQGCKHTSLVNLDFTCSFAILKYSRSVLQSH